MLNIIDDDYEDKDDLYSSFEDKSFTYNPTPRTINQKNDSTFITH
jgi:hypothetical protein